MQSKKFLYFCKLGSAVTNRSLFLLFFQIKPGSSMSLSGGRKLRGMPRGRGGGGGRIAPYTKDGGERAEKRGALPVEGSRFKSKASAPTVAQIEGDRLNDLSLKGRKA